MNEWTIRKGLKVEITGEAIPLSVQRYSENHQKIRTYVPLCQFDVDGNLRLRGTLKVSMGPYF